jgi:hypothetical protein
MADDSSPTINFSEILNHLVQFGVVVVAAIAAIASIPDPVLRLLLFRIEIGVGVLAVVVGLLSSLLTKEKRWDYALFAAIAVIFLVIAQRRICRLPDLKVIAIESSQKSVDECLKPAGLKITVKNDGEVMAGPFHTIFFGGKAVNCEWHLDSLPSGAQHEFFCPGGASDTYAYTAKVDSHEDVTENEEGNNELTKMVRATFPTCVSINAFTITRGRDGSETSVIEPGGVITATPDAILLITTDVSAPPEGEGSLVFVWYSGKGLVPGEAKGSMISYVPPAESGPDYIAVTIERNGKQVGKGYIFVSVQKPRK